MQPFKWCVAVYLAVSFCSSRTFASADIPLAFGTTYAGDFTDAGEQVGYAFTGAVGQRLYYDTLDSDFENIYVSLISPSGATVWQVNHSSDYGPFILAESGAYRLVFDPSGDTLGDYAFRLLDLGAAPVLTLGTAVTNQLSPPLGTDVYQFNGSAGERITLTSLFASVNQAQWRLIGPANQQLVNGNISSSLAEVVLPSTGPCFVLVEGNTAGGSPLLYEFNATGLLDAPVAVSGLDSVVSGALFAGQTNTSTFTAPAGLPVYFDSLDRGGVSLAVDLRDPSGALVFSIGETADAGPVTLPRSGTYSLNVRGNSPTDTGLFRFRLLNLTTTLPLPLNTNVISTLTNAYQTDVYQLTSSAGQRFYYDSLDNDFDQVTARFISSDGSASYMGTINSDSDFGPFTLTVSGTNYLILESSITGGPDYKFRLLDVGSAPVLALDTDLAGTLNPGRGALVYQLAGTAGQRLYFDGKGSDGGGNWGFYAPNNAVGFNNNLIYDGELTLGTSGTYVLVLSGNSDSVVTYSNRVVSFGYTTNALVLGSTVSNNIARPGEQQIYTFNGTNGQRLYYDALDGDYDLINAQLIDPAGNAVFINGNADSDVGPFTLVLTGTYRLVIDGNGATTGDYGFRLLDVDNSPALSLGATTIGQLDTRTETDFYVFSGSAGQRITLDSISATATEAQWFLFSPANQNLASGNITTDLGERVLPFTGTYCLMIQGTGSSASPLGYQVQLTGALDAPVAVSGLGVEISGGVFAGETNSTTFAGTEGLPIYFDALDRGGSALVVDLLDPIGGLVFSIAETADAGPFVLPRSGNYTVNIRGNSPSATGLYRFRILDLSAAPALALNNTTTNNLTPGYRTDVYQMNGSAGQRLLYDALESDGERTFPRLLAPNGNYPFSGIFSSSDFGPFTLPVSGVYYLFVEGDQIADNDYSFSVLNVGDQPVLGLDQVLTNGMAGYATTVYRLDGTNGQRLFFDAQTGGLNGYWNLYGPTDGSVSGAGLSGDFDVTLGAGGRYVLAVNNYSATPQTNLFQVVTYPTPVNTLTLGATVNGTISEAGQKDFYTFSGTLGQRLYYDGLQGDPDVNYVYLQAPSGAATYLNGYNADSDAGPFTLTETGTYRLEVYGSGDAVGDYSFRLLDVGSAPVLGLDQVLTNGMAGYATTVYRLDGTNGQRLFFDAQTGGLNGYWNLYGPTDGSVSGAGLSGDFDVTLGAGGRYVLAVNNYSATPQTNLFQVVTPNDAAGFPPFNRAPVLAHIGNQITGEGSPVTFTASASDADGNTLIFSLDAGAPAGATIGPVSGVFSWTPPFTGFSGTTNITVRVTDNGSPGLSAAETISIQIIAGPVMITVQKSANSATVFWRSAPGKHYRLQFKNTLDDATWTDIGGDVAATTFTTSEVDSTIGNNDQRYYRVLLLDPQ